MCTLVPFIFLHVISFFKENTCPAVTGVLKLSFNFPAQHEEDAIHGLKTNTPLGCLGF